MNQYRFTIRLLNKVWNVQYLGLKSEWNFKFRTYNHVSHGSAVVGCAILGDVEGIKELFMKGEATPNDTDMENGFTVLKGSFIRPDLDTLPILFANHQ